MRQGMGIHGLTLVQKQMELSKIKEADLNKFEAIINDKNLETKALLRKAVTYRKVEQIGTSYLYNSIKMGFNEATAIEWLNDPSNSGHRLSIVESVKEAR
jgi:hypothetical protein